MCIVRGNDNSFLEFFRAAYKGFADCIRLLLFLDAYRGRQDKEGKTVLISVTYHFFLILWVKHSNKPISLLGKGNAPYLLWFVYVKSGCTPLHWAAIRGNLEACTVLVQAGKKEDLIVTDNTGLTPAQLASDKNHRQVAFFLVSIHPWKKHFNVIKSRFALDDSRLIQSWLLRIIVI